MQVAQRDIVSLSAAITPAPFSANMPRNSPIPAAMAIFCDFGMPPMIHSRNGVRLRIRNRMPR